MVRRAVDDCFGIDYFEVDVDRYTNAHVVQGFVGLDPSSAISIRKAIRFGIYNSTFDIPKIIVTFKSKAFDYSGMRKIPCVWFRQWHYRLRVAELIDA